MHYFYHYVKDNYLTKITKSLDKNQVEKYNKIMKEIEEIKVVECSQDVPFKNEKEKDAMNEELLSFMNSQFADNTITSNCV
jgi:peroxiredoxin